MNIGQAAICLSLIIKESISEIQDATLIAELVEDAIIGHLDPGSTALTIQQTFGAGGEARKLGVLTLIGGWEAVPRLLHPPSSQEVILGERFVGNSG
jgi:hypothetical protein